MKTSKMFITIVTALAMASCNNDKEFANQPELEMQVPEAYALSPSVSPILREHAL